MIYHSVAEIFDSIDETRGRLQQRLADLSAPQENFKLDGGWSIAEITEHLAIMEEGMLRHLRQIEALMSSPEYQSATAGA